MTETNDKIIDMLKQRLGILIYLQLRKREIDEMTTGEQIFLLKRLGFDDGEIAHIFGRSKGYISSEIAKQKAKRKSNE